MGSPKRQVRAAASQMIGWRHIAKRVTASDARRPHMPAVTMLSPAAAIANATAVPMPICRILSIRNASTTEAK